MMSNKNNEIKFNYNDLVRWFREEEECYDDIKSLRVIENVSERILNRALNEAEKAKQVALAYKNYLNRNKIIAVIDILAYYGLGIDDIEEYSDYEKALFSANFSNEMLNNLVNELNEALK